MILNIKTSILCFFILLSACSNEVTSQAGALSNDPKVLLENAKEKQRIGAYDEAIEILNAAIKIDAKFVPAYNQMGLIFFESDRKDESVLVFKKAVVIDPENLQTRLGLGETYSLLTRNDLAVVQFLVAAEIKKNDPEILFKIALEYWYHQNLEKCKEYYNKVLAIEPNHVQVHLNLISVYERMKDWRHAIKEIEISKRLGEEKNDSTTISIAERKKKFIIGRMNLTEEEYLKKSQPPFD